MNYNTNNIHANSVARSVDVLGKNGLKNSFSAGKKLSEGELFFLVFEKVKKMEACVISMIGSVTHDISQHLTKTIGHYLDTTYIVKSSDEILADLSLLGVHMTEKKNILIRGRLHSPHVDKKGSINKKSCTTNHSNLIYPCKVYSFLATNHMLNPAFKWNIF